MSSPLKTFIIYSSHDRALRDELLQHLRPLIRAKKLSVWSDKEIPSGEDWNDEIKQNLAGTELFLPLISKNFFNSDFIQDTELPFAEQRRSEGLGYIIPILLSPCGYQIDPIIGKLEVIPKNIPINSKDWENEDAAWTHVIEKINIRAEQIFEEREGVKKAEIAENQRIENEKRLIEKQKAEAQIAENQRIENEKRLIENQKADALLKAKLEAENLVALEKKRLEDAQKQTLGLGRKSGFEMIRVEGGTFLMGSPENEPYRRENECQYSVTVKSFSIGKYPITQADWREIMKNDPPQLHFKGKTQCPVESVSWNDIQDFLIMLNKKTNKNYRLLTEAEWEFAARGGNQSKGFIYAGSNNLKEVAWFWDNSDSKTHPVGEKKANELGLHDMIGNVVEWCQDTFKPYPCDTKTKANELVRVLRGGSWFDSNYFNRVAYRDNYEPNNRSNYNGFRVARD
jgi:formylglycine-generating enzyme required for sulfatase activity